MTRTDTEALILTIIWLLTCCTFIQSGSTDYDSLYCVALGCIYLMMSHYNLGIDVMIWSHPEWHSAHPTILGNISSIISSIIDSLTNSDMCLEVKV